MLTPLLRIPGMAGAEADAAAAAAAAAARPPPPPPVPIADGVARTIDEGVAMLRDDVWLTAIIQESHGSVYVQIPEVTSCLPVARMSLNNLFHLGDVGGAPAGGYKGLYANLDAMLVHDNFRVELCKIAFLVLITQRLELQGTDAVRDEWGKLLNVNASYLTALVDPRLALLFAKLSSKREAQATTRVQGTMGGGGLTQGGAAAATTTNVSAHTSKLPIMKKEMTQRSMQYRLFNKWLSSAARNQTHDSLEAALLHHDAHINSWGVYLQKEAKKAGFDKNDESGHVQGWLKERMATMHPGDFAKLDCSAAKGNTQRPDEDVSEYLNRSSEDFEVAMLSVEDSDHTDVQITDEAERCKIAVAGLLSLTNTKVTEVLAQAKRELELRGTPLPDGHAGDHFTSWSVMEATTISVARASKLNPKPKKKPDSEEEGKPDLRLQDTKLKKELKAQRVMYVAAAIEKGDVFNGYGMMVKDVLYDVQSNTHHVAPCFTAGQISGLKLPPMLIKPDGTRAPEKEQICRHA